MTKKEEYEQKTEQLLTPIITENQFELVDVEYVKEVGTWYLRAYIDKPGGITIDDCELVSRALSDLLDNNDFITDAYILEVSSPGLTRPLKKDKDYERNIGKPIEFRLFTPLLGTREHTGILKEYSKTSIVVSIGDEELTVERTNLAMIRQAFEL